MPHTNKTFRVFVSSTFTDMQEERHILQKDVFPRLKALCESKGTSFQDVDLRWGVNEEAQLDQKIMDICIGEIARCQKLSPKPNFIVLLGDKYGWQPIPSRIPSSEMAIIRGELSADELALVDRWYCEDLNAVPSEYVLQPRGDDFREYSAWQNVESRLRRLLRSVVDRLAFPDDQKIKYFASATHQEIMTGALGTPIDDIQLGEHAFAYLRTIQDLPEDHTARDYIDMLGESRDNWSREQLKKLKEDLAGKLPKSHIYRYRAKWEDGCHIEELKSFSERVYSDLKSVIEKELAGIVDVDSLTREKNLHEEFKENRRKHFTGREDALRAIADYLDSPSQQVFTIMGASGSGKTSLIAQAIHEALDRNGVFTFRFLGTTARSSETSQLLSSLIDEITVAYYVDKSTLLQKDEDETKFSTQKGLQELLVRCFKMANQEKPLLVVLDALDQLSSDFDTLALDWDPRELPKHVKLVISTLPEMKEKLSHSIVYDLRAMDSGEGKELLTTWLGAIGRTLTTEQMLLVIERFTQKGSPLYLKLAFEIVRKWRSYDTGMTIRPDIFGILDEFFSDLERDHGLLLPKVCGYLLSGKYQGLMEQELLELLVTDEEYWQHFLEKCHPDHRPEVEEVKKLPIVIWSRLFLDLEPYLTTRNADDLPIISFYHRKFIDFINVKYITDSIPWHRRLADFFTAAPLYFDEKEERPNIRKVVEQPWQQTLAHQWEKVTNNTLASFPFLMSKVKARMIEEILDDYAILWNEAPGTLKMQLDPWRSFFQERVHILRRGDEDWPAYKILFQLSMEHAHESPITLGAEDYLSTGKVEWIWIRRNHLEREVGKDICISVLEWHKSRVIGAIELRNRRILSWSADKTLRLWTSDGKPLNILMGHAEQVEGALELRDGVILSWSADKTLRLWDRYGASLAIMRGHTENIKGALELQHGKILSWSEDKHLHIWNKDGGLFAIMKGHTDCILGALELQDRQIISWSADGTLRLWNHDGKPLATMEHRSWVLGAIELHNRKILSWADDGTLSLWYNNGEAFKVKVPFLNRKNIITKSEEVGGAIELHDDRVLTWHGHMIPAFSYDHNLRQWDKKGKLISVMEGHKESVSGAIELRDNKILSWSADEETLRLWDRDGQPLAVMEQNDCIDGVIELNNSTILSWSGLESSGIKFRLWTSDGASSMMMQGHTESIEGVLELWDGRILSWSEDHTLRLWDINKKPLTTMEGHAKGKICAFELQDGRILSREKFLNYPEDRILRLWAKDGKPLAVIEGHTGSIYGAIELRDGKLLSWSADETLRLWGGDGKPLSVMKGHKGSGWSDRLESSGDKFFRPQYQIIRFLGRNGKPPLVMLRREGLPIGVFELRDGRILSWGGEYVGWFKKEDSNLRLWDSDGKLLSVMKHKKMIWGALELRDGRILSWDKKLRMWSNDGQLIATMGRHKGEVIGALELQNGRIISRPRGKILRLWSSNGKTLASMKHKETVRGALELRDGRILSWDNNLRMWSNDGQILTVMDGHTENIGDVLELRDGKILSRSKGKILRLWGSDGKPLALMKHKETVGGALELRDGRILSWDSNLRMWNNDGQILTAMDGHTENIGGALELWNGNILSWSERQTFRLWDSSGKPIVVLDGSEDMRCILSNTVLANKGRTSLLLYVLSSKKRPRIFWHGSSACRGIILKPDGRIVVTQDLGQVDVLSLYRGDEQITVKNLEKAQGVKYNEYVQVDVAGGVSQRSN